MQTHDAPFINSPVEVEEMRCLLVKSYAVDRQPLNWRLARLENWIFGSRFLEPPEFFTNGAHLWRNSVGDLVAFVIHGSSFHHVQVDYSYRQLEPEIFDWSERHPIAGRGEIGTLVYDWDITRQKLLVERGFQNLGAIEDLRIYDLTRAVPDPVLPTGYRFSSVAEQPSHARRIELENRVWGVALDQDWFKGKSSSPSYDFDWDLLVMSPDDRQAAFSLVWRYPDNKTAEIDPLGTDPDFRRRGLARALVLESFRRLRQQGYLYAYIASDSSDSVVSRLYASFQPVETYQGYHWEKPIRLSS